MCSGKGLTAAVCAEAVPDVREVVMIDADDRMVLRHLESEPLVRFRRMDVYEEGVGAMMASAIGMMNEVVYRAKALSQIFGAVVVAGGWVHAWVCDLCGVMTRR